MKSTQLPLILIAERHESPFHSHLNTRGGDVHCLGQSSYLLFFTRNALARVSETQVTGLPEGPHHRIAAHPASQFPKLQSRAQANAAIPAGQRTMSNWLSLRLDITIAVGKVTLSWAP